MSYEDCFDNKEHQRLYEEAKARGDILAMHLLAPDFLGIRLREQQRIFESQQRDQQFRDRLNRRSSQLEADIIRWTGEYPNEQANINP